jgi:hypothetical protein
MINYKQIWNGLRIKAKAILNSDTIGELEVNSADGKLNYHDGTTRSPVLTETSTSTVTNKSIDADNNPISNLEVDNLKAGVLNTSTTLTGASDTQVPSALAVKTYVDNGLAQQNEASEISYDNTVSGLAATNVQDAIDEVDFDLDATQTILADHIADTTDAHDASAISNVPSGNLTSTDVQSALNELQTDVDTRALDSALQAHITDTTDAHDASAISVVPTGNLTSTDVQSALVELQTEIDGFSGFGDVNGPASSTDNAIARFDGITGKLIQNSTVTLSDTGVVAGLSLDADTNTVTNIEDADIKTGANITRAKLASGTANAVVHNDASGVMSNSSDLTVSANGLVLGTTKHLETQAQTDSTTTGANASLASFTAGVVRLTNSSLSSLANIPAGANGQQLVINNRTGNTILIVDSNAAVGTASRRIFTGNNVNMSLPNNASISLNYDTTTQRWQIEGISSSGTSTSKFIIKDLKNATAGGSSSTSFIARVMNTLFDPQGVVVNNASFTGVGGTNTTLTLSAGTYIMYGSSTLFSTGSIDVKSKLRNITDSTDAVIGQNARTTNGIANAPIIGSFTIASQKSFEIQVISTSAVATNGLGNVGGFGINEEYLSFVFEKIS